jgi:hypothetical protein
MHLPEAFCTTHGALGQVLVVFKNLLLKFLGYHVSKIPGQSDKSVAWFGTSGLLLVSLSEASCLQDGVGFLGNVGEMLLNRVVVNLVEFLNV